MTSKAPIHVPKNGYYFGARKGQERVTFTWSAQIRVMDRVSGFVRVCGYTGQACQRNVQEILECNGHGIDSERRNKSTGRCGSQNYRLPAKQPNFLPTSHAMVICGN